MKWMVVVRTHARLRIMKLNLLIAVELYRLIDVLISCTALLGLRICMSCSVLDNVWYYVCPSHF